MPIGIFICGTPSDSPVIPLKVETKNPLYLKATSIHRLTTQPSVRKTFDDGLPLRFYL